MTRLLRACYGIYAAAMFVVVNNVIESQLDERERRRGELRQPIEPNALVLEATRKAVDLSTLARRLTGDDPARVGRNRLGARSLTGSCLRGRHDLAAAGPAAA